MTTNIPTITTVLTGLPVSPSRTQTGNAFASPANTFLGALGPYQIETNQLVADVNVSVGAMNTLAGELNTLATSVSGFAQAAENASQVVNYQGAYSAGTAYTQGQTTSEDGIYWVSLQNGNQGNSLIIGGGWWSPVLNRVIPTIDMSAGWNLDLGKGNDFKRNAIAGTAAFTLSNVPAVGLYSGVLEFPYTSGSVTFFAGYTVEWADDINGGSQPTLETGKTYLLAFEIRGGTTVLRFTGIKAYS